MGQPFAAQNLDERGAWRTGEFTRRTTVRIVMEPAKAHPVGVLGFRLFRALP